MLVVTLRVGAVGMTLTSANRVYLFEPAFNPAAEVQAAGRIHRLGQTKDILVRRFAFKDSVEEQTVALHKEIKAGRIAVSNGMLPGAAVRLLTAADGVKQPKVKKARRSMWPGFGFSSS